MNHPHLDRIEECQIWNLQINAEFRILRNGYSVNLAHSIFFLDFDIKYEETCSSVPTVKPSTLEYEGQVFDAVSSGIKTFMLRLVGPVKYTET